jgi:hypothetical protein
MVNFYRRFLPGIARTLAPLTDALKGGRKGPTALEWSTAMQTAFQAAKEALCQASTLVHPDSTADLSLMVDASETHVGAVLQQRERGSPAWRLLGFFSHKLAAAQTRYSAFDWELLAIYIGIRYFRYMLEGRRFIVFTDHKPLLSLFTSRRRRGPPASSDTSRTLRSLGEISGMWPGPPTVLRTPSRSRPPPPFHAWLVREARQIQALLQHRAG